MTNVISFLQAIGADAKPMAESDYADAVATLDIDPEMRAALIARDQATINRLLGGRGNVFSLLVPAEDDDKKDEDDKDDEQKEQVRVA